MPYLCLEIGDLRPQGADGCLCLLEDLRPSGQELLEFHVPVGAKFGAACKAL